MNSVQGLSRDSVQTLTQYRQGFAQIRLVDSLYFTYIYDPEYRDVLRITDREAKEIRQDLRRDRGLEDLKVFQGLLQELDMTEEEFSQLGEESARQFGKGVEKESPVHMQARNLEEMFGNF